MTEERACGCRADPIVFGHTECEAGPAWIVRRVFRVSGSPPFLRAVVTSRP